MNPTTGSRLDARLVGYILLPMVSGLALTQLLLVHKLPSPLPHWVWLLTAVQLMTIAMSAWAMMRLLIIPVRTLSESNAAESIPIVSAPKPSRLPTDIQRLANVIHTLSGQNRRLQAQHNNLASVVFHDLRTPLTRMTLRAERLADDAIRSQLRQDMRLMAGIMDAAQDYLHGLPATESRQTLDIQALLESLAEDAQKGEAITISGRAAHLRAYPTALRRGIEGLIANALRYGGDAHIQLTDSPEQLVIEISDHGPGIPPECMESVFEPFLRLNADGIRPKGGLGLGLAIARACAQAHDGDLTLHNLPRGGLLASLTLPRH